jgi:hypothetical protein
VPVFPVAHKALSLPCPLPAAPPLFLSPFAPISKRLCVTRDILLCHSVTVDGFVALCFPWSHSFASHYILIMSNQPVNHFNIKRQAHALSRQNTNARYSPFAHIRWGRRETFPQDHTRDVEAQDAQGSPMTHSSTAPGALANEEGRDTGRSAGQDSGDTCVASTPSTADAERLRNRGKEAVPDTPTQDQPDDNNGKKKDAKKEHRLFKSVYPKEPFTVANQIQRTFLNSWINVLLVAAPVGIALHFTSVTPVAIFVVNFIAIIPLAAMLSFATEEIALRTGETLGGLLNATFGYECPAPLSWSAFYHGFANQCS